MTYTAMAGKCEAERDAAAAMLQIVQRTESMTPDEAKNVAYQGAKVERDKN